MQGEGVVGWSNVSAFISVPCGLENATVEDGADWRRTQVHWPVGHWQEEPQLQVHPGAGSGVASARNVLQMLGMDAVKHSNGGDSPILVVYELVWGAGWDLIVVLEVVLILDVACCWSTVNPGCLVVLIWGLKLSGVGH